MIFVISQVAIEHMRTRICFLRMEYIYERTHIHLNGPQINNLMRKSYQTPAIGPRTPKYAGPLSLKL